MVIAEIPRQAADMPIDPAQAWAFASERGIAGVVALAAIAALAFLWWYSEKRRKEDATEKGALQDKRVLERDEITRAVVTCNIALDNVTKAIDAGNKATEAHTRAVERCTDSLDSFREELRQVRSTIERLLDQRGARRS